MACFCLCVIWNNIHALPTLTQALYDVLPHKAKTIMDRLIAVSQDAVIKLGVEAASTLDYVNILK